MQKPATWPLLPVTAKTWDGIAGGKYHLIDTLPLWHSFYEQLKIKKQVACDLEATGLSYIDSKIIGFSFSWGAENSYYVPVRHETNEKQLDIDVIRPDLEEFFFDPSRVTIWHNAKFDCHFLKMENLTPRGVVHCTRLMHSLIREEQSTTALKKLAEVEIHPDAAKWEVAIDEFRATYARKNKIPKKMVHYGLIPLSLMVPYAASDGHYAWILYKKKLSQITSDPSLQELYLMESQLLWVLLNIEHNGVFIDRPYLERVGPELDIEIERLRGEIKQALGDVNPDSNMALAEPLQKMGVKLTKRTKSGNRFSLDSEVLEKLASKYKVCADLKEYRGVVKIKSTYIEGIINKLTDLWQLHCEYNQVVSTGRMSGKSPNLMNIPAKNKSIRRAFIPPKSVVCVSCSYERKHLVIPAKCPICGAKVITKEDYILVFMDYNQMEIRMTAHYSRDPVLLDVYNVTHQDVHLRTMCEIWGEYGYDDGLAILHDESHSDHIHVVEMRKIAKITNFLIIYGGGPSNLASNISTPDKQYTEAECRRFILSYFERLKGVRRWITRTKMSLRETGWVQNYFGRYRRFPELANLLKRVSRNAQWMIERCERQATNFLIQGTCADLFKIAMVRANSVLKDARSAVIMPIHDELVFYWHVDEFKHLGEVKAKMEDFNFEVPMTVDVSYSSSTWAEKHELKLAQAIR